MFEFCKAKLLHILLNLVVFFKQMIVKFKQQGRGMAPAK